MVDFFKIIINYYYFDKRDIISINLFFKYYVKKF